VSLCVCVLIQKTAVMDIPGCGKGDSVCVCLCACVSVSVCVCVCVCIYAFKTPVAAHVIHRYPSIPFHSNWNQMCNACRVGQNRIYTPYMTVCMVISLLKIPYVHRMYVYMFGSGPP